MTGKEIVKLLKQNGWYVERIHGSHNIMKKVDKTIVVPVHSNKDLPTGLQNSIFKQAGLK